MIEKDLAAGLLAKEVDADVLLILTDVPNVYVNYGKEDQKALETLSVQEAEELMAEGQFEAATMLPKIEAGLGFRHSWKSSKGCYHFSGKGTG